MRPEARIQTASEILDKVLDGAPAEQALTRWARSSRFAGSKDRAAIRDLVFDALRRKRSYAALGGAETGRGLMIGALRAQDRNPEDVFTGTRHAPAELSESERRSGRTPSGVEALDLPDWLVPHFEASLGDRAHAEARLLRERASVFLRVNTLKTTLDQAQKTLERDNVVCRPHAMSPSALEVLEGARSLRMTAAFRDGLIELQDAASQAVVDFLPLRKGMKCLDFCAGGGGKSLAIAAQTKAGVIAHDADPGRMADIPARALRAGADVVIKTGLSGQFDLVLCDAPCSGSGSWRRSPEAKWRLTPQRLQELTDIQAEILQRAQSLVASGGVLAYATCSLLAPENTGQVAAFLAATGGWRLVRDRQFYLGDGADGFYVALLARD